MHVMWSEGAIGDLEHIRRYLTAFDPAAARRLAARLIATIAALEQPATPPPQGIGQSSALRPFTIRYRIAKDQLAIMWVRQSHHGID